MAVEFLDCVALTVPAEHLEIFEAALGSVCRAVSFYHDEDHDSWDLQAVKERGADEDQLTAALAMAEAATGFAPVVTRALVPVGGWLAKTNMAFPEQYIGRRFVVRGTHIDTPDDPGRITLRLDAGLAFGTGEHHSTRGCLLALEHVAKSRQPAQILDVGTGSGILAIAASKIMRRPVLATDIDPRAVRVAAFNAQMNGVAGLIHTQKSDGWKSRTIRRRRPFDLVFANILARPLCGMAKYLAANLKDGGTAILSGLLTSQANWVLSAHRSVGLVLEARIEDGAWTTLILRRPG